MVKKILGGGAAVLLVLIGGGVAAASLMSPAQRAPLDVKVPRDAATVAHGKYLAHHVLGCVECHSSRDFSRYGGPVQGAIGAGGDCLGEAEGMPGRVCASNITPHETAGIGAWTDGEILRAIREGVSKDGTALFPMMPYEGYRNLSDEDAHAVVAYLRSLPASANEPGETKVDFPLNLIMKTIPQPLTGPVAAVKGEGVKRGAYLAKVSGCESCHTPVDDKHQPLEGYLLAGGQEFSILETKLKSPNLTPHENGLKMDEASFVARLTAMKPEFAQKVAPDAQTIMPWLTFSGMKPEDAASIFAYLKTVPAADYQGVGP